MVRHHSRQQIRLLPICCLPCYMASRKGSLRQQTKIIGHRSLALSPNYVYFCRGFEAMRQPHPHSQAYKIKASVAGCTSRLSVLDAGNQPDKPTAANVLPIEGNSGCRRFFYARNNHSARQLSHATIHPHPPDYEDGQHKLIQVTHEQVAVPHAPGTRASNSHGQHNGTGGDDPLRPVHPGRPA